jgi:cell division protein FtsB
MLLTPLTKSSILGGLKGSPFFMKKKVQKMLEWFYDDSDRGEQNISECKSIYELVEKLQWRMESLENEHMILLAEINKLKFGVCETESD